MKYQNNKDFGSEFLFFPPRFIDVYIQMNLFGDKYVQNLYSDSGK